MNFKLLILVLVLGVAGLGYLAWQRNTDRAQPTAMERVPTTDEPMMAPTGDAGVAWTAPERWTAEPPTGVRLATYVIPAAHGGEPAQCAVYFFGPGQGGGVDANIDRWVGEFKEPPAPERKTLDVSGMALHRVRVTGTYFAHAMGSGEQPPEQADATLIGGILEGPNGSLFFKLTGPAKTVSAAEGEFDAMLESLRAT